MRIKKHCRRPACSCQRGPTHTQLLQKNIRIEKHYSRPSGLCQASHTHVQQMFVWQRLLKNCGLIIYILLVQLSMFSMCQWLVGRQGIWEEWIVVEVGVGLEDKLVMHSFSCTHKYLQHTSLLYNKLNNNIYLLLTD